MNRLERAPELNEAILVHMDGRQQAIWTTMPAVVISVNLAANTLEARPVVQGRRQIQGTNDYENVPMPLCLDVPIVWPMGGGYSLTFPIAPGDECLLHFSARCIDAWWQSGAGPSDSLGPVGQPQAEFRWHDLSDGFAMVGVRSQPRVIPSVSAASVQLRRDDGTAYFEISGTTLNLITPGQVNVTAGGDVDVTAGGNANITAAGTATIQAVAIKLQATGSALKKLINDSFIALFNSHTHSGVSTGGGNTGGPNSSAGAGQETSVVTAE